MVPVPVAAMMAGSACWSSHSMVSPSDWWPSSRVSWNTLAAHVAGIRILRPRPSTFVCRSFVDLFAAGATANCWLLLLDFIPLAAAEEDSTSGVDLVAMAREASTAVVEAEADEEDGGGDDEEGEDDVVPGGGVGAEAARPAWIEMEPMK